MVGARTTLEMPPASAATFLRSSVALAVTIGATVPAAPSNQPLQCTPGGRPAAAPASTGATWSTPAVPCTAVGPVTPATGSRSLSAARSTNEADIRTAPTPSERT